MIGLEPNAALASVLFLEFGLVEGESRRARIVVEVERHVWVACGAEDALVRTRGYLLESIFDLFLRGVLLGDDLKGEDQNDRCRHADETP
jgi:hypothetical protein